jgi:hypothetical protein
MASFAWSGDRFFPRVAAAIGMDAVGRKLVAKTQDIDFVPATGVVAVAWLGDLRRLRVPADQLTCDPLNLSRNGSPLCA